VWPLSNGNGEKVTGHRQIKRFLRAAAERISRNLVLRRRLPKALGRKPLFVSPGVALRYWRIDTARTAPMLFRIACEYIKKGMIVWDVGASFALFALSAAYLTGQRGRVLALEPDTWCINLLRRTLALRENRTLQVDLLPVAIADRVILSGFNIAKRGRDPRVSYP